MAISTLVNTTWEIANTYLDFSTTFGMSLTFTSNNQLYTYFSTTNKVVKYDNTTYYQNNSWTNQAYRTISITGGSGATNATLISWLENNAIQQVTAVDITLGVHTLEGVDTIKIPSTTSGEYIDFKHGKEAVGTATIRIDGTTLTGVSSVVVTDTSDADATFGYDPGGFNVVLTGGPMNYVGSEYEGKLKVNAAPSSNSDYDVLWGQWYSDDITGFWNGTNYSNHKKILKNVKTLYCWGEYGTSINGVDLTSYTYDNPYVINVSQDASYVCICGAD